MKNRQAFEINWLEDRSNEALLAELRRVAALTPGRRMTMREFDSKSKISGSAVSERFGSWTKATRIAGLADALPDYKTDSMIVNLRKVSSSFPNDRFTIGFFTSHGKYSASAIKRRFGGWREALKAAGIEDRFVGPEITERMRTQPGRQWTNEQILDQIREISRRLGKQSLSGADLIANSALNYTLIDNRFGSVSNALRLAGVEQGRIGRRHTEEEVFENLLSVWTHYGRPPTVTEIDRPPSIITRNTYINRYGGWRKALKAFVERANSDPPGESDLKSQQDSSDPPERTGSPLLSAVDASAEVSNVFVRNDPPAPLVAKARLIVPRPEDQRDPKLGLRFKVLKRDQFRCQLCGRSPATVVGLELHIDHIVPFSKGGKTTAENLRALCAECNVGKSNRQ